MTSAPHVLRAENNHSTINVRKGEEIRIILESNPTTGYMWTRPTHMTVEAAQDLSCAVFQFQREEYKQDAAPPGMCGVGGVATLRLKCMKEGHHTLELVYCQVWEGISSKADAFTVEVECSN